MTSMRRLNRRASRAFPLLLALMLAAALSACGGDDNNDDMTNNDSGGSNPPSTNATVFRVTVTNVSQPGTLDTDRAMGAVPLSPGAYAVYTGNNPAFTAGQPASKGIERIAEDGFAAAPFGTEVGSLGAASQVTGSGLFAQPAGKVPALEPGESASFTVIAYPDEKLTLSTMFVQSNDWFYALDGLALFDDNGDAISGEVTDQVKLYDAGTEEDTAPGTGPDQKPAQDPKAVDQGPAQDQPVMLATNADPSFNIPPNDKVIKITVKPVKQVTATTFDVKITNDSSPGTLDTDRAMGTVPLSPGVYAVFSGDNPAFMAGQKANVGTERIAEDGFTAAPLGSEAESLASADETVRAGVFSQPMGKVPALEPGESTHFSVTAVAGDKLTLETMFVQSNDWFYALDGLALFDDNGDAISGDVTDQVKLYDAGTEADTAPGKGPDQKPAQDPKAVDQGPTEDVAIQLATKRHEDFAIPTNSQVIHITVTPRQQ